MASDRSSTSDPRGLAPATRGLFVFVPLACVVLNLLIPFLPWQPRQVMTSLDYTRAWRDGIAHEDSWRPMRLARDWLASPTDERLVYQKVFFEQGVKLQYPPTSLLPLDALALGGADWLGNDTLNGLSWLAVLATVLLSVRVLDRSSRDPPVGPADRGVRATLGVVAGLTFYPLVQGFYQGQIQTWIDALVAGLVLAWIAGRPATSGALAAVACLIKPQLGLLLLWGILRRQPRFVAGWLAVAAIAGAVSLWRYGFATHLDYLEVLSFLAQHGESFNPNQSVNGLAHRLLGNGPNRVWENAFPPYDVRVHAATLASSLLLVVGALFWRRREAGSALAIDLAIVVATSTIASPIAWTHHYAVLLPLFALALPGVLALERARGPLLVLLAVSYLLIANTWRALNQLADTPWNFLQSYVLFGGLLFLAILYRVRSLQAKPAASG
jgi:hypothetical protein